MVIKSDLVSIDIHRLHEEWVNQPIMFLEYATKLADAKEQVALTKSKMELLEAELSNSMRQGPELYGLGKVTEATIVAAVKAHPDYKLALKKYIRSKHEQDVLQGVVDALDHRKKALENLVHLHGMSYFSSPSEKSKLVKRK